MTANRSTVWSNGVRTGRNGAQTARERQCCYCSSRHRSLHYFDNLIIPDLKRRLHYYTFLSTPRTILTAGGALLDRTADGALQGFRTDNYGTQSPIADHNPNFAVVGGNIISVKGPVRKRIVSIFDVNKPRVEAGEISVPLRGENNDLYSSN